MNGPPAFSIITLVIMHPLPSPEEPQPPARVRATGRRRRSRRQHTLTQENVALGSFVASLASVGAVAAGLGAALGLVVLAATVFTGPDLRFALPPGIAAIASICCLLALVVLSIPFTLWAVGRDRRLLTELARGPERHEEMLGLRGRNAFVAGIAYAVPLFFLGCTAVTYGWHLLRGGDWNVWAMM